MIVDIFFAIALLGAVASGYRSGLLKSVFKTIGYIAGGIAGLYFSLKYTHSLLIILAIFLAASLGSAFGSLIASGFRKTILRGPLAFIDSVAGSFLEMVKVTFVFYLIATVLLWTPWTAGHDAVAQSRAYLKVSEHIPTVIAKVTKVIEKAFANPHL